MRVYTERERERERETERANKRPMGHIAQLRKKNQINNHHNVDYYEKKNYLLYEN